MIMDNTTGGVPPAGLDQVTVPAAADDSAGKPELFVYNTNATAPTAISDKKGQRQYAEIPNTENFYQPEDAEAWLNTLRQTPGSIDALITDLYWGKYFGDSAPIVGGDRYDIDTVKALQKAMDEANRAGAEDVSVVIAEKAWRGKALEAQSAGVTEDPAITVANDLREFARANGVSLGKKYIQKATAKVVAGGLDLNEELNRLRNQVVAGAYPAFADDIRKGLNVEDLTSAYKQTMADMLELDPDEIDLQDETLQKAFNSVDDSGKPSAVPLWKFKNDLRQDERWQYTDNAYNEVGMAVEGAARMMGL